jgi:hypothetical protein
LAIWLIGNGFNPFAIAGGSIKWIKAKENDTIRFKYQDNL